VQLFIVNATKTGLYNFLVVLGEFPCNTPTLGQLGWVEQVAVLYVVKICMYTTFSRLFCNPKVHPNSPQPAPILNHINPIHTLNDLLLFVTMFTYK
jgi:hypothetical protein